MAKEDLLEFADVVSEIVRVARANKVGVALVQRLKNEMGTRNPAPSPVAPHGLPPGANDDDALVGVPPAPYSGPLYTTPAGRGLLESYARESMTVVSDLGSHLADSPVGL